MHPGVSYDLNRPSGSTFVLLRPSGSQSDVLTGSVYTSLAQCLLIPKESFPTNFVFG